MVKVGKARSWIYGVLALLMICLLAGSVSAAWFRSSKRQQKKPAAPTFVVGSVVVFPFDQVGLSKVPETLGADMASALRTTLGGHAKCFLYLYSSKLAPVTRAKSDQELKTNEDVAPFTEDKTKALKLARLLGADYYLAGSIDDYMMDTAAKAAQMTVSVDLVNAKTGKLVKTVLVTGRTPDSSTRSEEDEARALAAGEVVAKLKVQLTEAAPVAEQPAK